MRLLKCVIVVCNAFNQHDHFHIKTISFQFVDNSFARWDNPSREITAMMLAHSKTIIMYQPCNE